MSDAGTATVKLSDLAERLDGASKELYKTTEALEPIQQRYEEAVGDFELALYESEKKLPSEKMRERMAVAAMDKELRWEYATLTARSERLRKRISDLKAQIDAQRSLVSAYKAEAEAIS